MTDDETTVPAEGNNETNSRDSAKLQAPLMAPAASAVPVPEEKQIATAPQNDFTKILESVKLPERRYFKAIADVAQPPLVGPEAEILEEHIVKKAGTPEGIPEVPKSLFKEDPGGGSERSSSIVAPFRTLKDDLQTVVREQKISLVHAATLEEEKRQGQEHFIPEQQEIRDRRSRRTIGFLFATVLFILLGLGAIFGVVFVMQQQQSATQAPQLSILFAEQSLDFSLDNQGPQALKNALAQDRTKQLGSLGSITRIVPTVQSTSTSRSSQESIASIAQFFSALGIQPPQELMGAIGPEFFFGFHVVDTEAPLLVIPVTSYDRAFAGMLSWEATIDTDLSPIFSSVSMTVATSGIPVQRTFQDAVMRNYDVRELTNDSGSVILYYSFPTPTILVIAQSPSSFTEILSRLQAQREL